VVWCGVVWGLCHAPNWLGAEENVCSSCRCSLLTFFSTGARSWRVMGPQSHHAM
jgi:hypothetical protein